MGEDFTTYLLPFFLGLGIGYWLRYIEKRKLKCANEVDHE